MESKIRSEDLTAVHRWQNTPSIHVVASLLAANSSSIPNLSTESIGLCYDELVLIQNAPRGLASSAAVQGMYVVRPRQEQGQV
jgi:hypothetical protein